jgi:transposase-like protein
MTKTQVEVITSVQRRRSWSRAEKERIVAAAMEPGNAAKTQLLANEPDEDDRERLRRRVYVYHAWGTIVGRTNDTS